MSKSSDAAAAARVQAGLDAQKREAQRAAQRVEQEKRQARSRARIDQAVRRKGGSG